MALTSDLARLLVKLGSSARFVLEGDSMLPALKHKQSVLAFRPRGLSSWAQSSLLVRGDIVVLRHPAQSNRVIIKRIVGLPDEEIRLEAGLVYLRGELLEEPYLDSGLFGRPGAEPENPIREWWNGGDEYFVLGDNRGDSQDSRAFGPISQELILGRVWFRCWPLGAWGGIRGGANRPN